MRKCRILATAVLLLAFFCVFAACGTESTEEAPEFSLELGAFDFDGREYILRDVYHHGDTALIPTSSENALDDLLLDHYEKVENLLNCKITRIVGDGSSFTMSLSAGIKYADMMNDYCSVIFNHFKAGMIMDYNEIEGIDLKSGKFGSENFIAAMTWGSGTYAIVAEYWGIPTPYYADAMLFNPRILREYSQPNPFDLYENKQWTWDNFESIAVAVTDTNSNPDKPIYAAGNNGYFSRAAFFSSGASVAKLNEDGKLVVNLPSTEARQAADWLMKLKDELQIFDPSSGGWEYYCDMFSAGQYAFLAEYSWVGLSKDNGRVGLYMEEEFSWIPFPRGPLGSNEILATYSGSNHAIFVPISAETDEIGYIIDALFEPLHENPYGWRENFRREVFWDDNSYNVYIDMQSTAISDYTLLTGSTNPLGVFSTVASGTRSFTEAFESISEALQAELDRNYNDYLK